MSMMASGTTGYTTNPAPDPIGEALQTLAAAPNPIRIIEQYLNDPTITPAARRILAAILYFGDILATTAVTA